MNKRVIPFLALFSSFGTLICCALPALLVSLGLGSSLVAVIGTFPRLVWFSENKEIVFGIAGVLIASSYISRRYGSSLDCPVDPELSAACQTARKSSVALLWISLAIYLCGGFFAFIAPMIIG